MTDDVIKWNRFQNIDSNQPTSHWWKRLSISQQLIVCLRVLVVDWMGIRSWVGTAGLMEVYRWPTCYCRDNASTSGIWSVVNDNQHLHSWTTVPSVLLVWIGYCETGGVIAWRQSAPVAQLVSAWYLCCGIFRKSNRHKRRKEKGQDEHE